MQIERILPQKLKKNTRLELKARNKKIKVTWQKENLPFRQTNLHFVISVGICFTDLQKINNWSNMIKHQPKQL